MQAALASGQPTCTGSRPCRRQANEGNGQEKGSRCSNGGSGVIGKLRLSVARPINAAEKEEGVNGKRHRFRWCRRDIRWIADVATRTLLLGIVLFVTPGTLRQDFISFLFLFFSFFFFFIERKSRLSDKPWREGIGDGTIVRSCRSNCRARVCFITVYRFLELYIN